VALSARQEYVRELSRLSKTDFTAGDAGHWFAENATPFYLYDQKKLPQTVGCAPDFVSHLAVFAGAGIGRLANFTG
jgi:hypothetical protein